MTRMTLTSYDERLQGYEMNRLTSERNLASLFLILNLIRVEVLKYPTHYY